ncbi:hypothetical protein HNQ96_002244 [Aminobacter lissarensis]|uniref:Uncharacterized protein n=1 Tax=Aminobacter carboxidus TaxID=376165 RepID=A0A8E1WEC0_9HYPH|nr:hypothetical protein [Aminobacter lissarensis]MBB6466379.1 hypothetical protein [Aminobacter lissarensis]
MPSDDSQVGELGVDVTIAGNDNATAPDRRTYELRGILVHYLEFIDGSDFDKKQKFATRL